MDQNWSKSWVRTLFFPKTQRTCPETQQKPSYCPTLPSPINEYFWLLNMLYLSQYVTPPYINMFESKKLTNKIKSNIKIMHEVTNLKTTNLK
jgi:hypothetical protein